MSRFPIIEVDDVVDSKVKAVYDEIIAELGFGIVPNIFKSMAIHPDLLEANWKKFKATMLTGFIPRTVKEMIGVAISQANNSQYALNVHLHGLSALGMSERVDSRASPKCAWRAAPPSRKAVSSGSFEV